MRISTLTMAAACAVTASAATAQDRPASPEMFRAMVDCRAIADDARRLACYDASVARIDQAEKAGDIVVADKAAIRETRRGLFGFTAGVGRIFGIGADGQDEDRLDEITVKVASVRRSRGGGWVLTFDNDSTWEQIDTRDFVMSPKVGQEAVIARAALGSYTVGVDGQRPIKFRRVN